MRKLWMVLLAAVFAGCSDGRITDPIDLVERVPRALGVEYEWIFRGWDGTRPVGQPSVQLRWDLPTNWNGEVFRVYGRRSGSGSYLLLATVTSCAEGRCRYTDLNVASGQGYDYYVATVDQRTDRETPSESAVQVDVPRMAPPAAPRPDTVVALDNALYLRWLPPADAADDAIWKYQVYLVELNDNSAQSVLYQVGGTDATGFLDLRATNGVEYSYRIAAVDFDGHISEMSPLLRGVPRPDYTAEVIYAFADRAERSGFRFVASDDLDPIVPGTSAEAHWRLEIADGEWMVRPLNGAEIHPTGVFTTALTCGPRSDADCVSVDQAPASGYGTSPVPVFSEYTYLLRVPGASAPRYAKLRVTLRGSDQNGRLIVFDWAYQTRPGVRSLSMME